MIVRSPSARFSSADIVSSPSCRQTATASLANTAATVSISKAAREAFAPSIAASASSAALV